MSTSASTPLAVIDIAPNPADPGQQQRIAAEVKLALRQQGFLYVSGLGLAPGCLEAAFGAAQRFFAGPESVKRLCAYTDADSNFGYQCVGGESLDPLSPPDLKEAFTMRNALAEGGPERHWPDEQFRAAALHLYQESLAAAYRVLNIIGAGLELPEDFFTVRHRGENVSLRFLHYPTNLVCREASQLGAGAHTDYGSITLLFQDAVGGLEVRGADGIWMPAPYIADSVVINTGDLMERWTNGRFPSTLHRVRPITGKRSRYSIALFVDPDPAVVVDCIPSCKAGGAAARFAPITAGEHIRQKIAATHGVST